MPNPNRFFHRLRSYDVAAEVDAALSNARASQMRPQDLPATPDPSRLQPPPDALVRVTPVADILALGDVGMTPISVDATNPVLVLQRPAGTRAYLLIQNQNAAGDLLVGFGVAPSTGLGLRIPAGGNGEWYDFVPQNDVWILGAVAVNTGVVIYCNK